MSAVLTVRTMCRERGLWEWVGIAPLCWDVCRFPFPFPLADAELNL
jgi:hypothetical protein